MKNNDILIAQKFSLEIIFRLVDVEKIIVHIFQIHLPIKDNVESSPFLKNVTVVIIRLLHTVTLYLNHLIIYTLPTFYVTKTTRLSFHVLTFIGHYSGLLYK